MRSNHFDEAADPAFAPRLSLLGRGSVGFPATREQRNSAELKSAFTSIVQHKRFDSEDARAYSTLPFERFFHVLMICGQVYAK